MKEINLALFIMILSHVEALPNACKTTQGRFLGLGTGYQLDSLTVTHPNGPAMDPVCMRTVYTYSNGKPAKYDTFNSPYCSDYYKNWDSSNYVYDSTTNSYKYARVLYEKKGTWKYFISNNFMIDSLIYDIDGAIDRIDRNYFGSNIYVSRSNFGGYLRYDSIIYNDSGRKLFRGDSSGIIGSITCEDRGDRCECSDGIIEFVKNGFIDSIYSGDWTNSYKYYWSSPSSQIFRLNKTGNTISAYKSKRGYRIDGRSVGKIGINSILTDPINNK